MQTPDCNSTVTPIAIAECNHHNDDTVSVNEC